MYYYSNLSGVGFSLKPPKFIRRVGRAAVGLVKKAAPLAIFIPGIGPVLAAGIAAGGSLLPGGGRTPGFAPLPPLPPPPATPIPFRERTQPASALSNQSTLLIGGGLLLAAIALSPRRT